MQYHPGITMDALAIFPIVHSNFGKPRFKIDEYDSYAQIHQFIPREHFKSRALAIHETVFREYPTPVSVYFTYGITAFVTIMLVTVSVINISGLWDSKFLFLPLLLVVVPIIFGILIRLRQKYYEKKIIEKFENSMAVALKEFNTQDIPSHAVKWVFRKRGTGYRVGSQYRILLFQADAETDVDTLPAYDVVQQDVVVLVSPEDDGRDSTDGRRPNRFFPPRYEQVRQIPPSQRPGSDRAPETETSGAANGEATSASGMSSVTPPPRLVIRGEPPGYDFAVQMAP